MVAWRCVQECRPSKTDLLFPWRKTEKKKETKWREVTRVVLLYVAHCNVMQCIMLATEHIVLGKITTL